MQRLLDNLNFVAVGFILGARQVMYKHLDVSINTSVAITYHIFHALQLQLSHGDRMLPHSASSVSNTSYHIKVLLSSTIEQTR